MTHFTFNIFLDTGYCVVTAFECLVILILFHQFGDPATMDPASSSQMQEAVQHSLFSHLSLRALVFFFLSHDNWLALEPGW